MRYHLQRAALADTVTRGPVEWEKVNSRLTEKAIRRLWWYRVNQPIYDQLYIYRVFDSKEGKVVEP